MEYRDKGAIPLTQPDPHGADFVDPVTGYTGIVYADVQHDHAFAVWWQPLGWLPTQPYSLALPGRWLLTWRAAVHDGHLKLWVTTSAAGGVEDMRAGILDLGPIGSL